MTGQKTDQDALRLAARFAWSALTTSPEGTCGSKSGAPFLLEAGTAPPEDVNWERVEEVLLELRTFGPYWQVLQKIAGEMSIPEGKRKWASISAYILEDEYEIARHATKQHFEYLLECMVETGHPQQIKASLGNVFPDRFYPSHVFALVLSMLATTPQLGETDAEKIGSCITWPTNVITTSVSKATVLKPRVVAEMGILDSSWAKTLLIKKNPFGVAMETEEWILVHRGIPLYALTTHKAQAVLGTIEKVLAMFNSNDRASQG
jgi:hydrogenase maturation factor